jgi:hypothetical protein
MLLASEQGADVISMSLGGFVPKNQPGGAALFSAFNRVANFVTAHGAVVFAGGRGQRGARSEPDRARRGTAGGCLQHHRGGRYH